MSRAVGASLSIAPALVAAAIASWSARAQGAVPVGAPEGGGEDEGGLEIGPPVVAAPPLARVWLRWVEHAALAPAGDDGARALVASSLALGVDWSALACWSATLEVRLRHRLDVGPDDDVGGAWQPEVRRARVRWTPSAGPELELGVDTPRAGRTLARPFDVASAVDWRFGPLGPEGGDFVPAFDVTLRQALGDGALVVRWAPFYVAAEPSRDAAPTQDVASSSELGARLTQRFGPLDVALGWAWRFDRSVLGFAEDVAPRQHVAGVELALATGPLRWGAEAALFDAIGLYDLDGARGRRALARWTFEVGAAPIVPLDVRVALEGAHALGPDASARTWLEGADDLWLRARVELMLAFDGVLRLDLETRVGLVRSDAWALAALTWRASDEVALALGGQLFVADEVDLGLAALYADEDQVWLRLRFEP